jgi:hypothetical protein
MTAAIGSMIVFARLSCLISFWLFSWSFQKSGWLCASSIAFSRSQAPT